MKNTGKPLEIVSDLSSINSKMKKELNIFSKLCPAAAFRLWDSSTNTSEVSNTRKLKILLELYLISPGKVENFLSRNTTEISNPS